MRILRLNLLAFGPFTDQWVEFGRDSGLHVVHGPNEAGKSSSLRALRSLLFGIPQQTPDDFIHSYQNLRIGGVFQAADGTQQEFIRRKGRTKTLRGPDDAEVFDESQLLTLLQGVDEATFSQRFGIDYEELRRGGELVVSGKGDLGEILFGAGAGVADLGDIQQRLKAEADALFKPRGSNQQIPQALSELEKARKEVRAAQLPTSKWIEHDRALRKAKQREQELREELTRNRGERSRLNRIGRSLALIGQLKPLREDLANLVDAQPLPDSFAADRREAEINLANAEQDEAKARREIERLEGELKRVDVPVDVLEHATAITQSHSELGIYQKAAKDRTGLIAERERVQRQARELLQELGRPTALDEADSLRLPKTKRRRIQDLAGECKARVTEQQSSAHAVQELNREIERVQTEIAALSAGRDISDLDQTIRQIQRHGDLDAQRLTVQTELERLRQQANIELARLPLFDGTLEELETLPVPKGPTLDRFENKLSNADRDIRRWEERLEELNAGCQDLQSKLDALRLEGEVPTEDDVKIARQRRDAGWTLVQQVWRDDSAADDTVVAAFVNEFAAGGNLATAFRASIERADTVADRLRREADRVAQNATLTADLQQMDSKLEDARERLEESKRHREEIWSEWQSQWEPAGIDALTPREMRSWQSSQQELVGIAAEIRQRAADYQRLVNQIDSLRTDLNRCLDALDKPRVLDREPVSRALDRCQEVAAAIRDENQRRERLVNDEKKLRRQQWESEQVAEDARQALDTWRKNWAEAVADLGLDGNATPSQANAVIETVDALLARLDDMRNLDGRIAGIDADAKQFERSVRELVEQVAPDLLDTLSDSVERAVADLVDRLDRAKKDQTKVNGWREQLEHQRAARDDAVSLITRWRETLEKLCEQAGCRSPDELPKAEELSSKRRKVESDVQTLEQRLSELTGGTALDEWIETAEQFDPDQVKADLTRLDEVIEEFEEELKNTLEAVGEHRNQLRQMDGSGNAAEAQMQTEHLLASIRSHAEEYIRWQLASAVLSRAMERFRESTQGPVLSRAAELFSTLTLGSFSELRADYDDSGNAVLVGVRPSGQMVGPTGMSDGTCDQLYLALRVALLESSLDGHEPLPFIVDDILIMFDDDRAAAALKVLSQLSEKTQVVFFTHHEHLVRIARNALDSASLHLHRL